MAPHLNHALTLTLALTLALTCFRRLERAEDPVGSPAPSSAADAAAVRLGDVTVRMTSPGSRSESGGTAVERWSLSVTHGQTDVITRSSAAQ